jgi:NADH dehydrogenase
LLQHGHEVRLLSRHAAEAAAEYPHGVQPVTAAIDDTDALLVAAHGCDAVLHVAGILTEEPPELTYENVNVRGTADLLKAAAENGAPYFVFVSSLGADRGSSDYHRSKRRAEELVRAYPGPWVIARPGNIYGPGDETVSTLLKLVRAFPAVPVVGEADQEFQPLRCHDFGEALACLVERRELAWQTLELAGPETTTTADLLRRIGDITGRRPMRVPVPAMLARAGTGFVEWIGGEKALAALGLAPPINTPKLQLLLEETLVPALRNALTTVFGIEPTPLDDGLAMLADALPEQTPAQGVGALTRTVYRAEIRRGRFTPEELISELAEHLAELMPIEFAAEPGAPTQATPGETMTGALPLRGHFQVRAVERTPRSFTLVTVEGHPLAGTVTFAAEARPPGISFEVRVLSRPADLADWIAMRTIGRWLQARNWRRVVQRVIAFSGGEAIGPVQKQSETLDETETKALEDWAESLVREHRRHEHAAELAHAPESPNR